MKHRLNSYVSRFTLCFIATASALVFTLPARADYPTSEAVQKELETSMAQLTEVNFPEKGIDLKYPKNWKEEEPQAGPIFCHFKDFSGLVSARFGTEKVPDDMTL